MLILLVSCLRNQKAFPKKSWDWCGDCFYIWCNSPSPRPNLDGNTDSLNEILANLDNCQIHWFLFYSFPIWTSRKTYILKDSHTKRDPWIQYTLRIKGFLWRKFIFVGIGQENFTPYPLWYPFNRDFFHE